MKTYLRVVTYGICIIILPVILIAGIYIADKNTRSVGFADRQPIFQYEELDEGLKITLFDSDITVSNDAITGLETMAQFVENKKSPLLNEAEIIVKMIFDLIHRSN